jgi:hypothetical protein
MRADRGLRHLVAAVVGAIVSFCLVAGGIYYRVAHVHVNGWMHGGPTMLAAAMAGLFGGGLTAVAVLIFLLRR